MAPYVRARVRRAQLLAAAEAALTRAGLDGLTLRAVAEEAGVRLSTLQYIFPSRAELVKALAEKVVDEPDRPGIEVGSAGLDAELRRVLHAYGSDVLTDDAYVELIRAELVAGATAPLRDDQIDYPAGRSILQELLGDAVVQACTRSSESYAVDPEELATVWRLALGGLLLAFLRDSDAEAFVRDGGLVVDALVAYARPTP